MPEIFACLTNAGAGGNTRFSCRTVSMFDDIAPPQGSRRIECYSFTPAFKRNNKDGPEKPRNERGARPQAVARFHLREPLAPASPLPRPDRRPGDLRLAVLAGALLPADGDVRRWRSLVAHSGFGHRGRRQTTDQAERDRAHAGRARPDRRGDDLEPTDHGDRRRLRNLRLPHGPRIASRPARVALARDRFGAQGQA